MKVLNHNFFVIIISFLLLSNSFALNCNDISFTINQLKENLSKKQAEADVHKLISKLENIKHETLDSDNENQIYNRIEEMEEDTIKTEDEMIEAAFYIGSGITLATFLTSIFKYKKFKTIKNTYLQNSSRLKRNTVKWAFAAIVVTNIIVTSGFTYQLNSLYDQKIKLIEKTEDLTNLGVSLSKINSYIKKINHLTIKIEEEIIELKKEAKFTDVSWSLSTGASCSKSVEKILKK